MKMVGPTGGAGQHQATPPRVMAMPTPEMKGPDSAAHAVAEDAPGHADDRAGMRGPRKAKVAPLTPRLREEGTAVDEQKDGEKPENRPKVMT